MEQTKNLGLIKPSRKEGMNIADFNTNADLIDTKFENVDTDLLVVNNRIDTHLNNLSENSQYDNAEVVDIRNGYNGSIYTSAGEAVRALGYELGNLEDSLKDFVDAEAVDGLLYEGNKLYLTANGKIVSDPVEILQGTGGGGTGGGGYTYTITLRNLLESRIISVAKGDEVNLFWEYLSVDEENFPDGAGIAYISVNNVRVITAAAQQGENITNITKYLVDGANTVKIQVENSEGSTKFLTYTVTVLALSVTTTFNDMQLVSQVVNFPYTVNGSGTKKTHFILDGYEHGVVNVETTGRSAIYPLVGLNDGGHILEVYSEVEVDGVTVKSNVLRRGMMWYSSTMTTSAILMMNFLQETATQGETLVIPYLVYDPFTQNVPITLSILDSNGDVYSSHNITVDHTPKNWTTQDYPAGEVTFKISTKDSSTEIKLDVTPSNFDKVPIKDSCVLEFVASGRSNSEENPAHWSYNDINATFQGFGWSTVDGWLEDKDNQTVLRFLPDDYMNIPFMPFPADQDLRTNGYTIEVELATHNVRDYDSTVISCISGDRGFIIKSQQAELKSNQSEVTIQFKEDDKVRLSFVIEQSSLNRFIYIYANGIMSQVIQYPANDDFGQINPVGITIGADSCGLDLYSMRLYNKGLNRMEILNNFIVDRPTLAERIEADERNDVLNESELVTIQSLPMTIPYMILECEELPQYKGDKKKKKSVTYVDPMKPETSFTATGVQFDVQGTSSAGYPVKNYKVAFKDGLTYSTSGQESDGFPINPGSLNAETLCLKADFASSENANNVMLVDFYEEIVPYETPPQEEDARVRQGIEGKPICVFWKNTNNDEITFIGKYNMNNDKSNENVFGFDPDKYPNAECWEFKNNTSNRVLFKESDFESTVTVTNPNGITETYPAWYDDFEARYPDTDPAYVNYTRFKRLTDWIVSTDRNAVNTQEEKAARLQKFKDEFEDYFIKDAMIFAYIFTEIFLMVDNRAKNFFATTFDGVHWFDFPYDFDTALGINNEGKLVFDYDLEDTDIIDGSLVYNGQESVMWNNIRDAFGTEIKDMYTTLRSGSKFNYEYLKNKMAVHQETWPEAIWNEDAYIKYLQPYLLKGENYLEMLQGNKRTQRDWWLYNAFKYRDSKYQCGDASANFITLRAYAVGDIKLTPYSHIWPRIKFGSATVTERGKRNIEYLMKCPLDTMNDTEVYIYSADRIAKISDLSHLKVGLANFAAATKLQEIIIGSDAEGYENNQLYSLDVGNNELLTLVNVQNCTNSEFSNVNLENCHSLETFLAKGSKLTSVDFPNGGHLKKAELPGTISNLTILNQKNLTDLTLESLDNLEILHLENCPNLEVEYLINNSPKLNRVRLIGMEWYADSEESLRTTINKLKACNGLDATGGQIGKAAVTGRVHVDSISDEFLEEINDLFSELVVVVNGVAKFFVKFINAEDVNGDGELDMLYRYIANEGETLKDPVALGLINIPSINDKEDATYTYSGWSGWDSLDKKVKQPYNIIAKYTGNFRIRFCNYKVDPFTMQQTNEVVILHEEWVTEGDTVIDPVVSSKINPPEKPQTAQFRYTFSEWNGSLENITEPKNYFPLFIESLVQYEVKFYNDNTLLETQKVYYGHTTSYSGDTSLIKKMINGNVSDYYEFTGWSPSPDEPITGATYYYAKFAFDGYIEDSWETIATNAAAGNIGQYGLGGRKAFTYIYNGQSYTTEAEIVGFGHDDLAVNDESYFNGNGVAAITFLCKDLNGANIKINTTTKEYLGEVSLNSGGWSQCEARQHLATMILPQMPSELRNVIKAVKKKSDTGILMGTPLYEQHGKDIIITEDKLWIPSVEELNGEYTNMVTGQGKAYPMFSDTMSRVKYYTDASGAEKAYTYWTRSCGTAGSHDWLSINTQGYPIESIGPGNNNELIIGFCI